VYRLKVRKKIGDWREKVLLTKMSGSYPDWDLGSRKMFQTNPHP